MQPELSTPQFDDYEKTAISTSEQEPPESVSTHEEDQWVSGVKLLAIMGAITLVCFLMLLDTSILVTVKAAALAVLLFLVDNRLPQAIPQITNSFNSLSDIGWYGAAYQLARCIDCHDFVSELTS